MLIPSSEEFDSFLTIERCVEALEKTYRSWYAGTAINRPRTDLVLPSPNESGVYAFKSMEAGLADSPVVAMRINSDIMRRGPARAHESTVEQPFWRAAPELRDLVTGRAEGRTSEGESTCFLNNIGIGLQFAAVGSAVYRQAKTKGIGREIPKDWSLESVHP